MSLPRRVVIKETIKGRYAPGTKPQRWDERVSGTDQVLTADGEELALNSGGAQCSPASGWELLLTGQTDTGEYRWTLYGIHP